MKIFGWALSLLIFFAVAMVYYPVVVSYLDNDRGSAYQQILRFHTAANAPQQHAQKPLLYLSSFPNGNPKRAEEDIIYANGEVKGRRVLWNNAIQGGGGQTRNRAALQALKTLPPLPPGLPSPEAVKYKNLLIVSQQVNNHWYTFYYDRSHLPVPVQEMENLVTAASRT